MITAKQDFSNYNAYKLFFYLIRIEILRIVKHPGFLLLSFVTISFLNSNFIGNVIGSGILPTTAFFINQITISEFPILLITLFFTGEITWRERSTNTALLLDTYPTPDWVIFSSKLVTLLTIQAFYALLIILFGVFSQLAIFHYYAIDIGLYFRIVFGIHLLHYWVWAIGFFFIQVLCPNKYIGFVIATTVVIIILIMPSIGIESIVFRYGILPDYRYSEMSGLDPFVTPIVLYTIYWLLVALILFMITYQIWPRGNEFKQNRLKRLVKNSSIGFKLVLIILLTAFITTGVNIYNRTVQPLNTSFSQAHALYEKQFQEYDGLPTPSIVSLKLNAELYTEERKVILDGNYLLVNKFNTPIDSFLVSYLPKKSKLHINQTYKSITHTGAWGTYVFYLKNKMHPGDSINLSFSCVLNADEFDIDNPNIDILKNGLLITNVGNDKALYFPQVGYDRQQEIQDMAIRKKLGLLRPPLGYRSLKQLSTSPNNWITFDAIISTSINQTAVSNGMLIKKWNSDNRAYFHYKTDTIINYEIAVASGNYNRLSETKGSVTYNIYYVPDHSSNLQNMISGVEKGVEIIEKFNPLYKHSSLSIVEIPNYQESLGRAYSMPTLILWNEDGGFLNNPVKKSDFSEVYSTALHEAAHQWWPHMVRPAKLVEGSMVINETLAQYVRMKGINETYGREQLQFFLKKECNEYFYERGASVNGESPLIKTMLPFVAYNKGSLIMHSISELIGQTYLNEAIGEYTRNWMYEQKVYPKSTDLKNQLLAICPDSVKTNIKEQFEKMILYDLSISSANFEKLKGNSFVVHASINVEKYSVDSLGYETQSPFRDYIPIVIIDSLGTKIYSGYKQIEGKLDITLKAKRKPYQITVDPNMIFLDKDWENNSSFFLHSK